MNLSKEIMIENFKKLSDYLAPKAIDVFYLSGSDYYLSEYTAKEDSLRNYLTPFRGSTSEVLLVPHHKILIFVDGRYHQQADIECAGYDHIEIVKVGTQNSISIEAINYIKNFDFKQVGCVAERTSFSYAEKISTVVESLVPISSNIVEELVGHSYKVSPSPVYMVSEKILPSEFEQKFKNLNLPVKQAIFLSSCDDIAWMSHCRSYQSPGNSYFFSKALVTSDHLYVFVSLETQIEVEARKCGEITFIQIDLNDFVKEFYELCKNNGITQVVYDPKTITYSDYMMLKRYFDESDLLRQAYPVTKFRTQKSFFELKEMERIFLLSSEAIAETIRIAKKSVKQNIPFSEKKLADTVYAEYFKRGAKSLSFNTISGVGPQSSIIHYGACSELNMLKSGVMTLLDSGAYYDSGLATDCTRCFIPEFNSLTDELKLKYKKFYTLVLKAQIAAEKSVFKPGTLGNAIDQCSRGVMLSHGLDFAHGLGHGVGVLVHDPGAGRLTPLSREELQPGVVCSIEPGYYQDGEFGIRLENVVYVAHHPKFSSLLYFKPLIFVGWEEELIDRSALSKDETTYLDWYQAECKKRGTLTEI